VPLGGGSYEIRLAGRLSDSVLAALECQAWGLTVSVEPAEMVLYGPVQDQDALGSLLDRILSQASTPVTVVSLPGRRAGLEMEGRDESHSTLWPLAGLCRVKRKPRYSARAASALTCIAVCIAYLAGGGSRVERRNTDGTREPLHPRLRDALVAPCSVAGGTQSLGKASFSGRSQSSSQGEDGSPRSGAG
jgi:hypothetical protein